MDKVISIINSLKSFYDYEWFVIKKTTTELLKKGIDITDALRSEGVLMRELIDKRFKLYRELKLLLRETKVFEIYKIDYIGDHKYTKNCEDCNGSIFDTCCSSKNVNFTSYYITKNKTPNELFEKNKKQIMKEYNLKEISGVNIVKIDNGYFFRLALNKYFINDNSPITSFEVDKLITTIGYFRFEECFQTDNYTDSEELEEYLSLNEDLLSSYKENMRKTISEKEFRCS